MKNNLCIISMILCFSLIIVPHSLALENDSVLTKNSSLSKDLLELNLEQLGKVVITSSSKIEQNINEVPSTVYIITGEQIKERGYLTLEEALSDLPGFQFRNIQSFNSYVFQRGIPNQNNLTLVLIDGIQINELNSGGFYAGGQYNFSNVERIEVLYGPSSVAYGTNAVSGIINIITKSASVKKLDFSTQYGSFDNFRSDINYCYFDEKKNIGYLFSGMVKRTNKADLKGKEGDYNWDDLMDNFENDYSFDLKIESKDFTLGLNLQDKQTSTATWMKSVGTIYKDYGTLWHIQFGNLYLKYKTEISKKISLSSILYARASNVLDNTVYFVVDTAQIGYFRPNHLYGFESILNYKFNNEFSCTGGLTLENEFLAEKATLSHSNSPEQKPPPPESPNMLNNQLLSAFVEPRFTIFKDFFMSGGVRFDESSVYHEVFSPRAGFSYLFKDHIIRFSYSEAFRAPKPWYYYDGLGNPNLHPERMKSYEGSVTLSIFRNLTVDFTGYKNNIDNALLKEVSETGYRWVNSGKIKKMDLRYI